MKSKLGICLECKEERYIYSKGMCQYHYWKSREKAKPKKSIKKFSDSMLKKLSKYRPLRDKYMSEHPICEFDGCSSKSEDLHHKKPRATHLCDVSVFSALCRKHHTYIHDNHDIGRKMGLLK